MWHWNSLWAPAPGDPPAVDDPSLWRSPWSLEQSIALQASTWEAMLSATHSWWTMALSMWPLPGWQPVGQIAASAREAAQPTDARNGKHLTLVHAPSPARKRSARPEDRHSLQSRKR